MGHTNVDVTLNIYTQVLDGSLRAAAETVGTGLFTIVHNCSQTGEGHAAKLLKTLARPAGLEPATSWFVARRSIQLS